MITIVQTDRDSGEGGRTRSVPGRGCVGKAGFWIGLPWAGRFAASQLGLADPVFIANRTLAANYTLPIGDAAAPLTDHIPLLSSGHT
jgi:hypothetical protein